VEESDGFGMWIAGRLVWRGARREGSVLESIRKLAVPHDQTQDGLGASQDGMPRRGRMRLTPTGAGPGDFEQDEHAREGEPADGARGGVRTFVMRMDRVEAARPAEVVREEVERELGGDVGPSGPGREERVRGMAAPASPELLREGMHDPTSDEGPGGDALDVVMQKLHAHRLSDDVGELSPTQMAIKARLIAQVIEANPTASHAFLQGFSPRQLRLYLDSLTIAREPRGTVRRRGKGTPAIEAYRPSA
jgi:hypothetical protein